MIAIIRSSKCHFSPIRLWIGRIVLLAVLMVASIPAGFMPTMAQADGHIEITVCAGAGEKTVLVDTKTGLPHMPPLHKTKTPLCDVLGGVFAQGQINSLANGITVAEPAMMLWRHVADARKLVFCDVCHSPYTARAPPVIA